MKNFALMAAALVLGFTLSIGELRTPPDTEPEERQWADDNGQAVVGRFEQGRLVSFRLETASEPDTRDTGPAGATP